MTAGGAHNDSVRLYYHTEEILKESSGLLDDSRMLLASSDRRPCPTLQILSANDSFYDSVDPRCRVNTWGSDSRGAFEAHENSEGMFVEHAGDGESVLAPDMVLDMFIESSGHAHIPTDDPDIHDVDSDRDGEGEGNDDPNNIFVPSPAVHGNVESKYPSSEQLDRLLEIPRRATRWKRADNRLTTKSPRQRFESPFANAVMAQPEEHEENKKHFMRNPDIILSEPVLSPLSGGSASVLDQSGVSSADGSAIASNNENTHASHNGGRVETPSRRHHSMSDDIGHIGEHYNDTSNDALNRSPQVSAAVSDTSGVINGTFDCTLEAPARKPRSHSMHSMESEKSDGMGGGFFMKDSGGAWLENWWDYGPHESHLKDKFTEIRNERSGKHVAPQENELKDPFENGLAGGGRDAVRVHDKKGDKDESLLGRKGVKEQVYVRRMSRESSGDDKRTYSGENDGAQEQQEYMKRYQTVDEIDMTTLFRDHRLRNCYEVTFNSSREIGIGLAMLRNSALVVKAFNRLDDGQMSPAKACGLVEIGDYLIAVNGVRLDVLEVEEIAEFLKNLENLEDTVTLRFRYRDLPFREEAPMMSPTEDGDSHGYGIRQGSIDMNDGYEDRRKSVSRSVDDSLSPPSSYPHMSEHGGGDIKDVPNGNMFHNCEGEEHMEINLEGYGVQSRLAYAPLVTAEMVRSDIRNRHCYPNVAVVSCFGSQWDNASNVREVALHAWEWRSYYIASRQSGFFAKKGKKYSFPEIMRSREDGAVYRDTEHLVWDEVRGGFVPFDVKFPNKPLVEWERFTSAVPVLEAYRTETGPDSLQDVRKVLDAHVQRRGSADLARELYKRPSQGGPDDPISTPAGPAGPAGPRPGTGLAGFRSRIASETYGVNDSIFTDVEDGGEGSRVGGEDDVPAVRRFSDLMRSDPMPSPAASSGVQVATEVSKVSTSAAVPARRECATSVVSQAADLLASVLASLEPYASPKAKRSAESLPPLSITMDIGQLTMRLCGPPTEETSRIHEEIPGLLDKWLCSFTPLPLASRLVLNSQVSNADKAAQGKAYSSSNAQSQRLLIWTRDLISLYVLMRICGKYLKYGNLPDRPSADPSLIALSRILHQRTSRFRQLPILLTMQPVDTVQAHQTTSFTDEECVSFLTKYGAYVHWDIIILAASVTDTYSQTYNLAFTNATKSTTYQKANHHFIQSLTSLTDRSLPSVIVAPSSPRERDQHLALESNKKARRDSYSADLSKDFQTAAFDLMQVLNTLGDNEEDLLAVLFTNLGTMFKKRPDIALLLAVEGFPLIRPSNVKRGLLGNDSTSLSVKTYTELRAAKEKKESQATRRSSLWTLAQSSASPSSPTQIASDWAVESKKHYHRYLTLLYATALNITANPRERNVNFGLKEVLACRQLVHEWVAISFELSRSNEASDSEYVCNDEVSVVDDLRKYGSEHPTVCAQTVLSLPGLFSYDFVDTAMLCSQYAAFREVIQICKNHLHEEKSALSQCASLLDRQTDLTSMQPSTEIADLFTRENPSAGAILAAIIVTSSKASSSVPDMVKSELMFIMKSQKIDGRVQTILNSVLCATELPFESRMCVGLAMRTMNWNVKLLSHALMLYREGAGVESARPRTRSNGHRRESVSNGRCIELRKVIQETSASLGEAIMLLWGMLLTAHAGRQRAISASMSASADTDDPLGAHSLNEPARAPSRLSIAHTVALVLSCIFDSAIGADIELSYVSAPDDSTTTSTASPSSVSEAVASPPRNDARKALRSDAAKLSKGTFTKKLVYLLCKGNEGKDGKGATIGKDKERDSASAACNPSLIDAMHSLAVRAAAPASSPHPQFPSSSEPNDPSSSSINVDTSSTLRDSPQAAYLAEAIMRVLIYSLGGRRTIEVVSLVPDLLNHVTVECLESVHTGSSE